MDSNSVRRTYGVSEMHSDSVRGHIQIWSRGHIQIRSGEHTEYWGHIQIRSGGHIECQGRSQIRSKGHRGSVCRPQPKQIHEIKDFLLTARRKDARYVKIKRSKILSSQGPSAPSNLYTLCVVMTQRS
ncbi:hypothetical protein HHK36_027284 [Tetracentron sinense]|uniref:Uncharacterized protein n=1 Tax=Tetracentron sinense TaxID=13715 RepID=A0A835D5E2_TETSI|nr:hypothetical protein HHK36_027284 [Tetracentron sinense]